MVTSDLVFISDTISVQQSLVCGVGRGLSRWGSAGWLGLLGVCRASAASGKAQSKSSS